MNEGLSRHAPTPMRQPHKPFHALPDTPCHQRDGLCVRRPPPPPHTLPPTRHARRDNPSFLPSFFFKRVSPPAGAVQTVLLWGKIVTGPLRGPVSDPRTPKPNCSPTIPASPSSPGAWLHCLSTPTLPWCGRVTEVLGHNRVDVVLRCYIR